MRRMWAKCRRLNRASRSASERLRLCRPKLSVLPLTTLPPGKKTLGGPVPPNPNLRRLGRRPRTPWTERDSESVAVEMTRRGKRGKVRPTANGGEKLAPGLFHASPRAWKSRQRQRRSISTFPQRRRRPGLQLPAIPGKIRSTFPAGSKFCARIPQDQFSPLRPYLDTPLFSLPSTATSPRRRHLGQQRCGVAQPRLLEKRALQEALHVGGAEDLLLEPLLHGAPQNLRAVALQNLVQPIHLAHPLPRLAMDDLGKIEKSRLPQIQQLLPLQITLASLARYRGHQGRAMRRQRRALVGTEFSGMHGCVATGDDPRPVRIQVQGPGHADRLGRHRVGVPVVQHRPRGAYVDRDAQGQLRRPHLQRTQPNRLLGQADGGDHSRRPARTFLVHLPMPVTELLLQILRVLEAPHLEEGSLHETYQVLYRTLFLSSVGPTEFHPDAHLQGGTGEDRIPLRDLAVPPPLQSHRLRSVEHTHQGRSSPTVQMLRQAAHQRLHRLILHQRDAHPAGVLQTRGKKADATHRPIPKLHLHLPEVVLAE